VRLRDLEAHIDQLLTDDWTTPTLVCDALGLGHGLDWYRVALLLERKVVAGEAEIKDPGARGARRFRRKREPA
jgi:hypothetical protein